MFDTQMFCRDVEICNGTSVAVCIHPDLNIKNASSEYVSLTFSVISKNYLDLKKKKFQWISNVSIVH